LKKAIKESGGLDRHGRINTAKLNSNNLFESSTQIFRAADEEVDLLMSRPEKVNLLAQTGGDVNDLSSFQQWQVKHFKYSTHTPAASEFHDVEGVSVAGLLRAITRRANRSRADISFDELFASSNNDLNELFGRRASSALGAAAMDANFDNEDQIVPGSSRSPSPNSSKNNVRRLTISRAGKLKPHLLSSYQRQLLSHSVDELPNVGPVVSPDPRLAMSQPGSISAMNSLLHSEQQQPVQSRQTIMRPNTNTTASFENVSLEKPLTGSKSVNFSTRESNMNVSANGATISSTTAAAAPSRSRTQQPIVMASTSGIPTRTSLSPLRRANSTIVQGRK
jgi:hypothetical protein